MLEEYGKYLCETGFCAATIRGYLSDIRSFARWFSVTLGEKRILERAAVHIYRGKTGGLTHPTVLPESRYIFFTAVRATSSKL